MDAILAGSIQPGHGARHPLRGPEGRPGHARDARDHRRAEGRRPGRRLRADHRRPVQRRHVGLLHRPRRAGGRRRRPDRVRRATATGSASTCTTKPLDLLVDDAELARRRRGLGAATRRATRAACSASTPSSCRAPRPARSPTSSDQSVARPMTNVLVLTGVSPRCSGVRVTAWEGLGWRSSGMLRRSSFGSIDWNRSAA